MVSDARQNIQVGYLLENVNQTAINSANHLL